METGSEVMIRLRCGITRLERVTRRSFARDQAGETAKRAGVGSRHFLT